MPKICSNEEAQAIKQRDTLATHIINKQRIVTYNKGKHKVNTDA